MDFHIGAGLVMAPPLCNRISAAIANNQYSFVDGSSSVVIMAALLRRPKV
jgi:hypothetical protein